MQPSEDLEWQVTSINLCGYVYILDANLEPRRAMPHNDTFPRKVFMHELPNPFREETWDTPSINETLVPQRHSLLDETGKWCFTAFSGLWRIYPEKGPSEADLVWNQHDIKAFVRNDGMFPLVFT